MTCQDIPTGGYNTAVIDRMRKEIDKELRNDQAEIQARKRRIRSNLHLNKLNEQSVEWKAPLF